MIRALSRLFRRARREDGTATIEFVIVVPIVMVISLRHAWQASSSTA